MVSYPSLPEIGKPANPADIEEATILPAIGAAFAPGAGNTAAARKLRAMRVAVIVFVALAVGQFMQSYQPSGRAVAMALTPQQAMLAQAQSPGAKAVLTPAPPGPMVLASAISGGAGAGHVGAAGFGMVSARMGGQARAATRRQADAPVVAAPGCAAKLRVVDAPEAMLGLEVAAPCRGGERVVLLHAGLAVTGKLDAGGHLSTVLPALETAGAVSVVFADGARVRGAAAVPELAGMRRLALEWRPGGDFALHGLEDGAEIGKPGDVSEAHPGVPSGKRGWLVRLGVADVASPLLAEVYTFPADSSVVARVAIVARVTPRTCGRAMLGQTIASTGGKAEATDLTLAMPGCNIAAGALVLRDLFTDMQVATSD